MPAKQSVEKLGQAPRDKVFSRQLRCRFGASPIFQQPGPLPGNRRPAKCLP
jgi:hypothetical protein